MRLIRKTLIAISLARSKQTRRSRGVATFPQSNSRHTWSSPTLYEFLREAGVHLPRSEKFYGLALPLGGAEVTMEDLVRLYGALANNGELRPLRRTLSSNAADARTTPAYS